MSAVERRRSVRCGLPLTLETNFSRPYKAISSSANSDFSLLDDLERLIRGTYIDPRTGKYRVEQRDQVQLRLPLGLAHGELAPGRA